ncbi:MAG: type I DNA topoisomerase, partial [Acidobacteria bacterium]|nr:type I DNA topoisomerase [Acidobacteriota bacterium]
MPKSLVIVESPAKARTINRYLGKDFSVQASMGHVRDLPQKRLGVDLDNRFRPTYELIPGKEKVIKALRSAARGVDSIYIATDPDREGEAIGWHLSEALSDNNRKFFRVLFNEITQKAIRQAFDRPGEIDSRLVDAQQARRILDRLVGYKISPLLWKKVRRGTSAGRVQTAALRLVVEREREIEAFEAKEYWTITANLSASQPPPFDARLQKFKRKKIEVNNGEQAQEIVQALDGASFTVEAVTTKEKTRNPATPSMTRTLQQEASRKLRFPVKKTMRVAQGLYEGIKLGQEGSIGLITYMRTDSLRVSNDALGEVRTYIDRNYGKQYLPAKARYYRSRKDAQDAHEAIRPTSAARRPEEIRQFLGDDEFKLYKLIWQRFVASQMQAALLDQTVVEIAAGPYLFRASGSVLKFDGFLKVYEEGRDDRSEDEPATSLPPLTRGEVLHLNKLLPEQHFTQPPPRFTEATLVKALEEKGIGRPSTYAAILTTIQEREYTVRKEGRFRPTDLGLVVNDLLVASFADLFDIRYTARMEKELDEIEQGKIPWIKALQDFYGKFATDLDQARDRMKVKEEQTGESCDKCGKPLVIRWGRHGRFVACSG